MGYDEPNQSPSRGHVPSRAALNALYLAGTKPAGMTTVGNIDLAHRPQVRNSDGSTSTVRSIGVNINGKELLIPTVSDDGRVVSDDDAVAMYRKTGKHLGMFDSPEASDAYAQQLHEQQEQAYGLKP